jgi:hypothetical protein
MSELEEKQLKLGFPEIEEKDTSPICCNDKDNPGFSCEWKVERVLLPQPTTLGGDGGLSSLMNLGLDGGIPTGVPTGLPSPTGMSNPMGGATLDMDAGLQNIGQSLTQSFGGAGVSGLLSMVFGLVYPSLKPMLEAAIRKVTVIVHWTEGRHDRDLTLMQYITNPSRAGLLAAVADAGGAGEGGGLPTNVGGGAGGGAGSPFPGMQGGPAPGTAPMGPR